MNAHKLALTEKAVFQELTAVLETFTQEQRLLIGATTNWSAKDVLAHLLAWEVAVLEELATIRRGAWQPRRITREELHAMNNAQVAAGSERTFESLIDEFRETRSHLRKAYSTIMAESEHFEPVRRVVKVHCIRHCGRHLKQLIEWQHRLWRNPSRVSQSVA